MPLSARLCPTSTGLSTLANWLEERLGAGVLSGVDQSKWRFVTLEPTRHYWALFGKPRTYRVEEAIANLDRDTWTSKDSDIGKGDRVLFWRGAYGGQRGIVGLGEVESDPKEMLPSRASLPYFVNKADIKREPRVYIRIVRPPRAPLWLDDDSKGVLGSLSVAKARGGTVFVVKRNQWTRVLELLGGWTELPGSRSTRTDYRRLTERIEARDRISERAQRTEQSFLRKHLLGGRSHGACCLCGRDFPVEFLVAAHVKRRASCSPDERGDTRNVVPMCRFGCDEVFERGFVYVLDGKVTPNDEMMLTATKPLREYLRHLAMLPCLQWRRAEQFFEWHAQRHMKPSR